MLKSLILALGLAAFAGPAFASGDDPAPVCKDDAGKVIECPVAKPADEAKS